MRSKANAARVSVPRSSPRAVASAQAAARRASLPPCRRSNASTSSPSASAASAAEPGGSSRPEPTSHASSARSSLDPGDELGDLPERDPPLAGALEVRPARRRLCGVAPVEDEGIAEVVAVRDREEPRPEVVVLALAERGVVAEPVRVEHLAVDHHRRVEERRREERRPPHGARPGRHPMDATDPTVVPEVDRAGPDDRRGGDGAHPRHEPLEPGRARDVVRVEARDVAPTRRADADVEGAGEAERLVVPQDAKPRVLETAEELPRAVDRAVVDDDELEVAERLAEHARHRLVDRRARVAGREDDGD